MSETNNWRGKRTIDILTPSFPLLVYSTTGHERNTNNAKHNRYPRLPRNRFLYTFQDKDEGGWVWLAKIRVRDVLYCLPVRGVVAVTLSSRGLLSFHMVVHPSSWAHSPLWRTVRQTTSPDRIRAARKRKPYGYTCRQLSYSSTLLLPANTTCTVFSTQTFVESNSVSRNVWKYD